MQRENKAGGETERHRERKRERVMTGIESVRRIETRLKEKVSQTEATTVEIRSYDFNAEISRRLRRLNVIFLLI